MAAMSKLPNASVQTDKGPTPEINKRYVIHAENAVCFEFIYAVLHFHQACNSCSCLNSLVPGTHRQRITTKDRFGKIIHNIY